MGTLLKDYIKSLADSYRTASGTTDLVKGIDLPSKIAELTTKEAEPEYTLDSMEESNSYFGFSDRFIAIRLFPSFLNTVDFTDEEFELMNIFRESRDIDSVDYSMVKLFVEGFTTFDKDVNSLVSPLSSVIDETVLKSWIGNYVPEGTKINYVHTPYEAFSMIAFTDNDIDFDSMLIQDPVSESEEGSGDSYHVVIPEGLYKFYFKGNHIKNEELEVAAGEITRGEM